jgi:hypothetical protein
MLCKVFNFLYKKKASEREKERQRTNAYIQVFEYFKRKGSERNLEEEKERRKEREEEEGGERRDREVER